MVETKGVQLLTILHTFEQKRMMVDWVDFFQQSLDTGWKPTNTLSKIEEALNEVKGKVHTDVVIKRLTSLWETSQKE